METSEKIQEAFDLGVEHFRVYGYNPQNPFDYNTPLQDAAYRLGLDSEAKLIKLLDQGVRI